WPLAGLLLLLAVACQGNRVTSVKYEIVSLSPEQAGRVGQTLQGRNGAVILSSDPAKTLVAVAYSTCNANGGNGVVNVKHVDRELRITVYPAPSASEQGCIGVWKQDGVLAKVPGNQVSSTRLIVTGTTA